VAVLYFTHGTLLQQLSALNVENSRQEWAKYCSISAVEMGLDKAGTQIQRELSFDINNDHVKEKVSYDVLT
jgi:cytolysin (calcineurin-like family phosphatase)